LEVLVVEKWPDVPEACVGDDMLRSGIDTISCVFCAGFERIDTVVRRRDRRRRFIQGEWWQSYKESAFALNAALSL
jgi:hypothetical protein